MGTQDERIGWAKNRSLNKGADGSYDEMRDAEKELEWLEAYGKLDLS